MRYFISGHLDVDTVYFEKWYAPKLAEAVETCDSTFVVGDARGVDTMAIEWLLNRVEPHRITMCHIGNTPRIRVPNGVTVVGGFYSDEERDAYMTRITDLDIARARTESETILLYGKKYRQGRVSGTQKNINRRLKANNSG